MRHWRRFTKFKQCVLFVALLISTMFGVSQAADSRETLRDYPFAFGDPLDSRNVVRNSIALNKLGYDFYRDGISPVLPDWADPWIEPVWSFLLTFNLTMWPHDFGHWARANQAGGDFVIDQYGFPFPLARMVVPADATLAQETLMSGGGFEINTLMRKHTEDLSFQTGSRDAEDVVHSFIQTLLFPLYSIAIAPVDVDSTDFWAESYGDPAQYTELVYRHYYGRAVITADNRVDPSLVRLYREVFWVNLLSIAVDPWMYKSARAFTYDLKQRPKISAPWLYRSDDISWAYTSRFNTGLLGYEVYLTQHLQLRQRYFSVYLRYGRPFRNYGLGLRIPEVIARGPVSLGVAIDAWDQEIDGKGGMIAITPGYRINRSMSVEMDLHWKTAGYSVGLPVAEGPGWLMRATVYW